MLQAFNLSKAIDKDCALVWGEDTNVLTYFLFFCMCTNWLFKTYWCGKVMFHCLFTCIISDKQSPVILVLQCVFIFSDLLSIIDLEQFFCDAPLSNFIYVSCLLGSLFFVCLFCFYLGMCNFHLMWKILPLLSKYFFFFHLCLPFQGLWFHVH